MRFFGLRAAVLALAVVTVTFSACNSSKGTANKPGEPASAAPSEPAVETAGIKITGSDTMVNLAAAWQEAYKKNNPDVALQVSGGGSGVGIAALCSGTIDIATSSRPLKDAEREKAKINTGKTPVEFKVGLDALAIYVNKDNPIETISIPELAGIYGEGGTIDKWQDLGVDNKACPSGNIVRYSRQNSSGTYQYFKEAVIGEKGSYKDGAIQQGGSSDVVGAVTKNPCAIGYSGMGYRTPEVKLVPVSKEKGQPGVAPSSETALDGTYPISRPLFLYTLGEPEGNVKAFIDWCMGAEGQAVVEEVGYVANPKK